MKRYNYDELFVQFSNRVERYMIQLLLMLMSLLLFAQLFLTALNIPVVTEVSKEEGLIYNEQLARQWMQ